MFKLLIKHKMEPVNLKTPEPKPKKIYSKWMIGVTLLSLFGIVHLIKNWDKIVADNVEAPYMPYVGLTIVVGTLIAALVYLYKGKG